MSPENQLFLEVSPMERPVSPLSCSVDGRAVLGGEQPGSWVPFQLHCVDAIFTEPARPVTLQIGSP